MAAPPPPNPTPTVIHEQPNDPNMLPLWFECAMQQFRQDVQNDVRTIIRVEVFPDIRRLMNKSRVNGTVIPYEVVAFINGDDPTRPPHNLPPLYSSNAIKTLNDEDLIAYLIGYGVNPLPTGKDPNETNYFQKETLRRSVGGGVTLD